MKKHVCLFLVVTMLFSFLGGCQKAAPEPEEVLPEVPVVTPKPEVVDAVPQEVKEPEVGSHPDSSSNGIVGNDIDTLTNAERTALEHFRNEPKEPWGEKDISIYSIYGEILKTPILPTSSNDYLNKFAGLNDFAKSVSYRGIMIGDDAIEALNRMDIPKQAAYTHNYMYEQIPEFAGEKRQPYVYEEVCDWINLMKDIGCVLSISIRFDKEYRVVSTATDKINDTNGYYGVSISVERGQISSYFAIVFDYGNF